LHFSALANTPDSPDPLTVGGVVLYFPGRGYRSKSRVTNINQTLSIEFMKIVFIGAGSHFFESVLLEIAQTPELHGSKLFLYDIDAERMALIEQVGRRISDHFKAGLVLTATQDLPLALEGADAAISSIGVHGPAFAYHLRDVDAVAAFGIMQTTGDSVGPSGVSQGLRIIPPYLELARAMEKYCPDCVLLNHSNPMSAICRAVSKYSKIKVIGYCHNVAHAISSFAKVLEVEPAELDYSVAGVNHMVWLLTLRHKGNDIYPELRRRMLESEAAQGLQFTRELLEVTGLCLVGGDRHIIEFFPHARKPQTPAEIGYGMKWRANMISEGLVSEELTKAASNLRARASGKDPLILPSKMSPEAMGLQIKALKLGPDKLHVVNVPNCGAVTNVPPWAVMELKCVVGMHGALPVHMGELPAVAARWTLAQIYAHELMIDAAAEGSRQKALQALASDPMVRDFGEAAQILDALVEAQGERLAPFRKSR